MAVVNVVDFARARLPELEALEAALEAAEEGPEEARHLRRKNRSHVRRFVATAKPGAAPTRRQRRRASTLLASRDAHAAEDGPKSRLLETHAWHAKRFAMGDVDGWRLPLRRNDRGLKAARRSLETAALVFDATYDRPVAVAGSAAAGSFGDAVCHRFGDVAWVWPRCRDREAFVASLGAAARDVDGGLVRVLVRGAKASDVLAAALGVHHLSATAAVRVRDPRDDRAAAAEADDAIFDAAARRASTAAVRAVRDDILNGDRRSSDRPPPLDFPALVVKIRDAGWDVVVPTAWGRPVFQALVTRGGGHAGGVDERALADVVAAGGDAGAHVRLRGPGRRRKKAASS